MYLFRFYLEILFRFHDRFLGFHVTGFFDQRPLTSCLQLAQFRYRPVNIFSFRHHGFSDRFKFAGNGLNAADSPYQLLACDLGLLQKKLAGEIMKMVHSAEDLDQAIEASEILFGKGTTETLKKLNEKTLLSVLEGVPQFLQERDVLNGGVNIADLLGEKTAVFASIPPPA